MNLANQTPWLSIIIPVYNEADLVASAIQKLQQILKNTVEIIIVDSSPTAISKPYAGALYIHTNKPMRSHQMNLGADKASASLLLFLHIDTVLPTSVTDLRLTINNITTDHYYGAFYKKFYSDNIFLRLISFINNLQLSLGKNFLGDNAFFIQKELFNQVGKFPNIALMEDVALSKTLKQAGSKKGITFLPIKQPVITSARKFEKNGVIKTFLLMQSMRLRYFFGTSPEKLRAIYYQK